MTPTMLPSSGISTVCRGIRTWPRVLRPPLGAFDGTAYSAPAAITLSVTDLNFAPNASSGSVITDEDAATTISLRATDQL